MHISKIIISNYENFALKAFHISKPAVRALNYIIKKIFKKIHIKKTNLKNSVPNTFHISKPPVLQKIAHSQNYCVKFY